ncbi:MAG TPA: TetR/AcrR family transcriptional regulator [Thermoanaerobaculia bacterium]|nr:TetR/AcrR family transcriptional regulator [Thermoanaerobaculia bacterium]
MSNSSTFPRRERAIEYARREILDAAAGCFGRKGYRGTTVSEIARAAGYTPPTLYSYFTGKEEIYQAILTLVTEEFLATFETPTPRGLTFEQKIELLLRRQLQIADDRRDFMTIYFSVASSALQQPPVPAGFERYAARLAGWLKRESRPADRAGRAPEDVAWAMAGVVYSFVRRACAVGSSEPLLERADLICDLVLHGSSGCWRTIHGERSSS